MITNGSILKVKNLLPLQRLPFVVPNNGSTVPNIAVIATKIVQVFCQRHYTFFWSLSIHSDSSCQSLEETIKGAIVSQSYQQIPALLSSSKGIGWNQNPFSFLSTFPFKCRTQIIDEILQSFVPLRPRSCLQVAYDCLLSYTLQNPQPFPLHLQSFNELFDLVVFQFLKSTFFFPLLGWIIGTSLCVSGISCWK
ncbi:hypothetical protein Nepgr_009124 [Nepenthes gracilis]|uniref:Uncharacterized protein n=1 Tax=Nepenthes gracilis TaxID=150966 RepID=A0AAD3SAT9_NEPGR|nr:hypothetical protein Nepgr_009124 [Nepenthes gracilis]